VLLATAISNAPSTDIVYAWLGAITKTEKDADGNTLVYGKVTDGTVDSDDQIVDPAFAKKALAEWYETAANVRQMHSTSMAPAGKGIMLESLPDGEYVKTRVVEPTAIKLCDNDVYTGYSVGISRPRIERDPKARGGRIVGGKIVEISLVDRPANPMAKFAVLKANGANHLAFIGKSVTIPEAYRFGREPLTLKNLRKGTRVSLDVNDEYGGITSVEGRFITKGIGGSIAIDQAGFTDDGTVKRLQVSDIVGVRQYKAAGVTHTHMHPGPDGVPHDHEHTHAPNHGDHSQTHSHDHPEDSVADTKPTAPDDDSAGPDADDTAEKTAKCGKCSGSGQFKGHDCADCGGSGVLTTTKAADGKCTKCGGSGQFDGAKCAACDGSGTLTKAAAKPAAVAPAAAAAPVADPPDAADPGPDAENSAPGEDVAPGEPEVDPGPDADDKTKAKAAKKAAKAARKAAKQAASATKGIQVVVADNGWAVTKNGTVIGTHSSQGAAVAQANAIKAETKATAKAAEPAKPETAAAEIPWLVRRAHDYSCGAYKLADVAAAYPTVEKISGVIGGATRSAIYTALVAEVDRDGGSGSEAGSIAGLGKSLGAIQDLITTKADTAAAHDDLHDAFKAANGIMAEGDGPSIPKPSETITPGQFTRGYISAGHQQEKASSHSADIPTTTHPIHAEDFTRGPLTDGHQRYLASKLADLHDGIADWRPEICRMDASGSFAFDRQPYPSADDRPPYLRRISNSDTASPTAIDVASSAKSPGEKVINAEVVPGVARFSDADFEEALSKALVNAQAPILTKLEDLSRQYEELASSPDTSRSAPRGVTGLRNGASNVEKISQADGAAQKARQGRKAERIEYLQSIDRSGDPDARLTAQKELTRMGVDLD